MSVPTATATRASQDARLLRAFLHREVAAGASLAALIEANHPAIQLVRAYRLVTWLPCVGEIKATRMVRTLPGHVRFERLTPMQRGVLLERVRAEERRIRKRRRL